MLLNSCQDEALARLNQNEARREKEKQGKKQDAQH